VTLCVTANAEGGMQNNEGDSEIYRSSFCILHFEVADTGIGIAPDQLERIFQPFEQAGEIGKRVEGTGLGLAISRQIVQQMGGRLEVESKLGQGSAFWFDVTLPVLEAVDQEKVTPFRAIVGYEGARRKVLMADDKAHNRQMLVDLLVPLGFEVSTAGNGQETIDKALAWQPDAIVLDLVMPVKTGFEAAQEIRQRPEFDAKRVCVIAVSASVLEADQEKSRVAGCDAFLPKPIEAQRLLDLLAAHLGLAWVYAEAQAGSEAPLVPPPTEELAALYQLADEGRILDIQAQAARLQKLGEAYIPFANRLQKLARGFEIDQIKTFLKQFMR
jgi:CheY-like chemotaxis protein